MILRNIVPKFSQIRFCS